MDETSFRSIRLDYYRNKTYNRITKRSSKNKKFKKFTNRQKMHICSDCIHLGTAYCRTSIKYNHKWYERVYTLYPSILFTSTTDYFDDYIDDYEYSINNTISKYRN